VPRKAKSPQAGTPGTPYANRSDLTLPVSTAPGQEYGQAAEQQVAQGAIPMAAGERPNPQGQAPQTPESAAPAPSAPVPAPGSMPFLHPTTKPDEPVTGGIPQGAGAGPEVLGKMPGRSLAQELQMLASTPDTSPALQQLAQVAAKAGM
jgi:hypothetical protein